MMRTLLKGILAWGLLSLADHAATAQTQFPACPPTGKSIHLLYLTSVTGCPFSAIMEIESTQTLADGTHIQKKSRAFIYRDSLGRIRYESYAFTPADKDRLESPNMIQIFDPVAGFAYWLMPQNATATRSRLDGAAPSPKVNTQPQQAPARDAASTQTQEPKPERVAERLGTQLMEGLLATGRRDVLTIPAGAEGNDRPVVIISEIWESTDMGIRLLVRRSDPRTGNIEQRMTNLTRTEPDASLFQVPADYTIKSE